MKIAIIGCLIALGALASVPGVNASNIALPLKTQGRFIVDSAGDRVKWSCVNWYGAHMKQFVPNGLTEKSPAQMASMIKSMGFNCVRLPYSTAAHLTNPAVHPEYISAMTETSSQRFLTVFDSCVEALTEAGLMVIINNHNTDPTWCCSNDDGNGMWYNSRFTEENWTASLAGMATRYNANPLVVGYDLRNEPRLDYDMQTIQTYGSALAPFWGEEGSLLIPAGALAATPVPVTIKDLRHAYEIAGAAVLAAAPNALIIVEPFYAGIICAWQLEKYPLRGFDGHLVWSVHEYSWFSVTRMVANDLCGSEFSKEQFVASIAHYAANDPGLAPSSTVWEERIHSAWGHLLEGPNAAPIWMGEFGQNTEDDHWKWLTGYMDFHDLDFAYWSLDGYAYPEAAEALGDASPKHEQDETYGILNPDYTTVRHDWKLTTLQALQGATPQRALNSTGFVSDAAATSCGMLKKDYKSNYCCGNPTKMVGDRTCGDLKDFYKQHQCCGAPTKVVPRP